MLIGYSQPVTTGYQIAGTSAGAGWVGSSQDGLTDGKPARKALFQWHAGPANTSAAVRFVIDHVGAIHKPRIAALLGLSVPEGTLCFAQPRLAAVVNNTAAVSTRSVKLADGSVAAWFVLPAEVNGDGFDFVIYNDVNGTSPFNASTQVSVGEAVFMPAVDTGGQSQWSEDVIDPSIHSRTLGSQLNTVKRPKYRRLELPLSIDELTRVRGSALANAMNWTKLRVALLSGNRCIAIPRWKTSAGLVDSAALHSTALYGQCTRFAEIGHLGGDYYSSSLGFDEIPSQ